MNRINDYIENIKILFEVMLEHKKKSLAAILIILSIGIFAWNRIPSALSCTWDAVVDQGVPYDQWRYNPWSNKCQYFNQTRWIPLQKVVDVGGSGEEFETE